ncbi:hypothetical protein KR044_007688, partial [Drosophila immigrans]
KQGKVECIVLRNLDELKYKGYFKDADESKLMSLIVPKVLTELQVYEQLNEETQSIRQTMKSYIQHSKVVSEDIAEIFLDLHNIYSKLEKFDKVDRQEKKLKHDRKFMKRIEEAENYLESKKHYISNDAPILACASTNADVAFSSQNDDDIGCSYIGQAEKQAFLMNMLTVKKSDFSIELNRKKKFYTEAERALKASASPHQND